MLRLASRAILRRNMPVRWTLRFAQLTGRLRFRLGCRRLLIARLATMTVSSKRSNISIAARNPSMGISSRRRREHLGLLASRWEMEFVPALWKTRDCLPRRRAHNLFCLGGGREVEN